jgi:hypothetical protein
MATATIVSIPDRYTCRGVTWLANGQQCTLGVPKGEYDMLGECNLTYTDLGRLKEGKGYKMQNIANGEIWYVGIEVAGFLMRDHLRPMGSKAE